MKHTIPNKLRQGDVLYFATKDGVYQRVIEQAKYNYYSWGNQNITNYILSAPINPNLPQLDTWAYRNSLDTEYAPDDTFYDIKDAYAHSIKLNKKTISRKEKTLLKLPKEITEIADRVIALEAIAATL